MIEAQRPGDKVLQNFVANPVHSLTLLSVSFSLTLEANTMHICTLHFQILHSKVHATQRAHVLGMILDFLNYISIDIMHLGVRLLSALCVLTS